MGLTFGDRQEVDMAPIYKEASFPAYYREAKVRQIMGAVYKLRSIAITGLAGMGKSNVVRFIVSHPQVRPRYLKERANDYAFVHVDCTSLAESNEAEILSEIAAQLRHDGLSAGDAHPPRVPHNIRRALKEQILSVESNLNLVLVLDYFDEAAAKLDKTFFNYLFHLRNARPRGNLSFIFATRRPIGHLHELQELLDDGCTIGPLSQKDALDSIRRDEARMGCTFDAAQRDKLIACTSGHPGFLKNAAELLGSGQVDTSLSGGEIARQLLQSDKVRNLCQELWNDLTTAEQGALLNAARGIPLSESVDGAGVAYLEQNGLLVRRKGGQGSLDVAVFCPLFETFVREKFIASGAVRITAVFPNQARLETPTGEEWITLPPKLFALLLALSEARGQVLPTDEMISRVYGSEAAGVTNAALSQLVKRLRGALDPRVQRMTNDPTYTCVETIRDVGYRLNG
jgi:DNA-binding winged helix-turn-helix (wHTH) protein